jgi:hypothetical protein
VRESFSLTDELTGLIWHPDKLAQGKCVEHPGCPNHASDALLYGWRHCYPYLSDAAPKPPPASGTEDYYAAEVDRMWSQEIEDLEAEREDEEPVGLGEDYARTDPRFLH